ncbi:hypothetical protein K7862_34780, partial [Streptomyces sp. PLK6-54]|nr:hypothetical protein [Streptomyces acidipaludis]
TGILGVLAILTAPFEPLGAIFAGAALVTGALALSAHVLAKLAGADVSWMQLGLDALGVLPGIGLFGKAAKVAKVADETAQAGKAAEFGKGFAYTVDRGRQVFAMGAKNAEELTGGVRFKNIVLFGSKEFGFVSKEGSTIANRLANVSNNAYHQGQWLGTRGIKLLTFNKLKINPLSELSTGFDAGLKLLPKVISIPQHVGEAVHLGDRFHEATETK